MSARRTMRTDETVLARVGALRTELLDLAFVLECRGRLDAADLAVMTSARLAAICDEFSRVALPPRVGAERGE